MGISDELREKIFTALGAASTCWDFPENAGVFNSDKCLEIGEDLIRAVEAENANRIAHIEEMVEKLVASDEKLAKEREELSASLNAGGGLGAILGVIGES